MKPKLVLDPGHGGHDPGAVGPTGYTEAEAVLAICLAMRDAMAPLVDVTLTRETNTFLTLLERSEFSNQRGPDLFLSIHCNSATRPASGFEVFTTRGETAADPFATALFTRYASDFPHLAARKDTRDGDPDKEASFSVLRHTHAPAVLFEVEFIHTMTGEAWIRDHIPNIAASLARGILEFTGIDAPLHPETAASPEPTPPAPIDLEEARRAVDSMAWQLNKLRDAIGLD
jgi:N-acetylmuramoyl-L-alanine amidase